MKGEGGVEGEEGEGKGRRVNHIREERCRGREGGTEGGERGREGGEGERDERLLTAIDSLQASRQESSSGPDWATASWRMVSSL